MTRDVSGESSSVAWLPVMEAVARAEDGDMFMMPPTYLTCLDVGQHAAPADVLTEARSREVDDVHAGVVPDGRRVRAVDAGAVRAAGRAERR